MRNSCPQGPSSLVAEGGKWTQCLLWGSKGECCNSQYSYCYMSHKCSSNTDSANVLLFPGLREGSGNYKTEKDRATRRTQYQAEPGPWMSPWTLYPCFLQAPFLQSSPQLKKQSHQLWASPSTHGLTQGGQDPFLQLQSNRNPSVGRMTISSSVILNCRWSCPSRDIPRCLEMFSIVTTAGGGRLLVSCRWRPEMLLNILQHMGWCPQQRTIQ